MPTTPYSNIGADTIQQILAAMAKASESVYGGLGAAGVSRSPIAVSGIQDRLLDPYMEKVQSMLPSLLMAEADKQQQAEQFNKSYGLSSQAQALQRILGLGNLNETRRMNTANIDDMTATRALNDALMKLNLRKQDFAEESFWPDWWGKLAGIGTSALTAGFGKDNLAELLKMLTGGGDNGGSIRSTNPNLNMDAFNALGLLQ